MPATDENAPPHSEDATAGAIPSKRMTRRSSAAAAAAAGSSEPGSKQSQMDMSPRKLSRRMAQPRKSILKQAILSPARSPASPKSNLTAVLASKRRQSISGSPSKLSKSASASTRSSPARAAAPLFRPKVREQHAHTTDFSQLRREMDLAQQEQQAQQELDDDFEDMPALSDSQGSRANMPRVSMGAPASSSNNHAHTINYSSSGSISGTQSLRASSNSPASKDKQKAERRAYLALARASRKSVSFAPHAYVRMFEKEDKDNKTPGTAVGSGARTMTSAEAASNAAVQAQAQASIGVNEADKENVQRNVFAFVVDPPAAVEKGPEQREADLKAERRASLIAVAAERSASARSRHFRGSSITGIPMAPSPTATANPPAASVSQRRNAFEPVEPVATPTPEQDEGETMDMDIESDEDGVAADESVGAEGHQHWNQNVFDPVEPSASAPMAFVMQTQTTTTRTRLSTGTDLGDDMSMDMDMTQVMGGAIYQGYPAFTASAAKSPQRAADSDDEDSDAGADNTLDADEEKTMDFTVAVGGFIPSLPPVGAWNDRNSIGYGVNIPAAHAAFEPIDTVLTGEIVINPQITSSPLTSRVAPMMNPFASASDGQGSVFTLPVMPRISYGDMNGADESMEMEETTAFGGVISPRAADADESMDSSANHDERDGMDFTVAGGGIFGGTMFNVDPPSGITSTTPTDEIEPVPSYAKPTVASVSRNIFGPSPSPKRTPNGSRADQPRGRDVEAAKSVAKKIDFTSSASAPGTPNANGTPKRAPARPSLLGNVALPIIITSPYKSPRRSTAHAFYPHTSVDGTPVRPVRSESAAPSPARQLGKSPARKLFSGAPEWAQQEYSNITLANFLDMTGVHFLESMPTAGRRKSTIAGGLSAEVQARMRDVDASAEHSYKLSEYTNAMVETLHFNMYQWGCTQMRNDIATSQQALDQTDRDASEDNPPVIREYLAASDEEKGFFELTIKNLKTNAHLIAREKWYAWKHSLVSQVEPAVVAILQSMKEDEKRIHALQGQVDSVLPRLHERYTALQAELEAEKRAIIEIDGCDQDELKSLKADVAEQNTQIEAFSADLRDTESKLEQLTAKHAELEATKHAHQSAISIAKKECAHQKGFSKNEVYSLRAEFSSIQHLHLWQLERLEEGGIQMTFDSEIKLTAKCQAFKPELTSVEFELLDPATAGGKADGTTRSLYAMLLKLVESCGSRMRSFSELVQQVGQWWSSVQRVRAEVRLITLRYPTSCSVNGALRVTANLVIPATRSKVRMQFVIDPDVLASWPHNIHQVEAEVSRVYGPVDDVALTKVARDTMDIAQPGMYLGAMLQSCLEVIAA